MRPKGERWLSRWSCCVDDGVRSDPRWRVTEAGNVRGYRPDFLVERIDTAKELHEVKGGQFMQNPDTIRKHEAARNWCRQRGMKFVVVTKK